MISKYKLRTMLDKKLPSMKCGLKENKNLAKKLKAEFEKLLVGKKGLGYFNQNSDVLERINEIDKLLASIEAKEKFLLTEDWIGKNELETVYDNAIAQVQLMPFLYYKKTNRIIDYEHIVDELLNEKSTMSQMYINAEADADAITMRAHPNRVKSHFFYKVDFDKWEKALVKGTGVALFYQIGGHKAYYKNIDNRKYSISLFRLITTSIEYGFTKEKTYNYIKAVSYTEYPRYRIYKLYNKLINLK